MSWRRSAIIVVASAAVGVAAGSAQAATVDLGAADSFAVLGGTTVTSAGVSTVAGNLAVSPGTTITGFPPGEVFGTMHAGDTAAGAAHAGLAVAYSDAAGRSPETPVLGDLGGQTLTPGVYAAGAALTLAGDVRLDAEGDSDAVFVIKAGSTLGTAADSTVTLIGGAQACNVFWAVGSSATLGATSHFEGSILAATSVSMGSGATVDGRILAIDGAVTMIGNTVTASPCLTGELSITAPSIAPFTTELTGFDQTVTTAVGAWSVEDARGTGAGYSITVAAGNPTVDGSVAAAGTGGSLILTPRTATASAGNPTQVGPASMSAQVLGPVASTVARADPGTGQGTWEYAPDTGATRSLSIVIPGDSRAGAYSSTLTFTTAPPVP